MKIETADAAQRLATALLADIRLYNEDAIESGDDLSEVLTEARALYQSRVEPQWHPLFEQTVAAVLTARSGSAPTIDPSAPPITTPTTPTTSASSSNLLWFTFGLIGLTATIVWHLSR